MLRVFKHGVLTAEGALRRDKFLNVIGLSAVVALVAICLVVTAVRAGAIDEPVGECRFVMLAVAHLAFHFRNVAVFVKFVKNVASDFAVHRGVCPAENIKTDVQLFGNRFHFAVHHFDVLARLHFEFHGAHVTCRAVVVRPADIDCVITIGAVEAGKDVAREPTPSNVTKVRKTIDVK